MEQTPLEIIESVDMNRLIEMIFRLEMVLIDEITFSVDTNSDLKKVNRLMKGDKFRQTIYIVNGI